MPSIEKLSLRIEESEGAGAALVTYQLIGSPQDNAQKRVYVETVELIGVDRLLGEDGRDDVIATARIGNSVVFPLATPDQQRLIALPAARLNEDLPTGPFDRTAERDEIRARVTLRRAATATVSAESKTVFLHVPVSDPGPL